MELELYTGYLIYKDIQFSFSFFDDELRLIPPQNKIDEISKWGLKEISKNHYTNGNPILIENEYLIGVINETGQRIVFFPKKQPVGKYNEILRVGIYNYMILNNPSISSIDFYSKEINAIYPPSKNFSGYGKNQETGEITLYTKKLHSRDDNIKFKYKGKEVSLYFSCERNVNILGGINPITINSFLSLTFEKTEDYSFVIDLYHIMESLLMFMFNNRHISTQKCILYSLYDDGKLYRSGNLYTTEPYRNLAEVEIIKRKKYIRYDYLKLSFSRIIQDIADKKLYLRHLPKDYEDSRIITPSRFVMIVAGFENLFKLLYPNGVVHSKSTLKKNEKFKELIEDFKATQSLNSDMRRKFNRIVEEISHDSVKVRLDYVYECNKELIDFFARLPFQLNEVDFDFSNVAEKVQKYRNLFAHGGIFDDFDINGLLGLDLLEKVNYIIQLKYYEIPENLIKKSINDLFNCSLMIND